MFNPLVVRSGKEFLQATHHLPGKHKAQSLPNVHLPLIVTSNLTVQQTGGTPAMKPALKRRIKVVVFVNKTNIQ